MKIVTVLGARPQFIKASVVSQHIARSSRITEVVVHTGQHFDDNMSGVFFAELGMDPPAHRLDIHGGSHGEMTARMLIEIERLLQVERPDVVLVYGDTNSTLAGAIAAAKLCIPIAHVEAGLRSFNMAMPEEINRIVTDRVARWLFAPTQTAVENLQHEGVDAPRICLVGDVMYDVALHHGACTPLEGSVLERLGLTAATYILATIHRAENTNDLKRLRAIVDALVDVGRSVPIVWPLHPRTRGVLNDIGLFDTVSRHVRVIDPVGYLAMVELEKNAALVATDSGGVQKEAFFHGVACVTLRDETEWVELVHAGWNRVCPPVDAPVVADALRASLGTHGRPIQPYGDGAAAQRIVERLAQFAD